LRKLAPFELDREISLVDEFLEKIDGKPLHLLRAPYGAVDDKVRTAAKTPILDWSIDTLDWTGISADEICQKTNTDDLEKAFLVLASEKK
jgi:peptidoglycan/xylan/chitin deacetylase (PgdA/CDA1 family)